MSLKNVIYHWLNISVVFLFSISEDIHFQWKQCLLSLILAFKKSYFKLFKWFLKKYGQENSQINIFNLNEKVCSYTIVTLTYVSLTYVTPHLHRLDWKNKFLNPFWSQCYINHTCLFIKNYYFNQNLFMVSKI